MFLKIFVLGDSILENGVIQNKEKSYTHRRMQLQIFFFLCAGDYIAILLFYTGDLFEISLLYFQSLLSNANQI